MSPCKRILSFAAVALLTVCPAVCPIVSSPCAWAQEVPSQRLLPLPERDMMDMSQQMELLKKLRALVDSRQKSETPSDKDSKSENGKRPSESPTSRNSARQNSPKPDDAGTPSGSTSSNSTQPDSTQPDSNPSDSPPSIAPQQLEKLQDALKKLTDQLPPGFVPPDLSSMPPEQLQQAMENPAVQQTMKNMLQQFSKDGVLPPTNGEGNPIPPILPPSENPKSPKPKPQDDGDAKSGHEKSPTDENSDPENSEQPPASSMKLLQDFLKKLGEKPPADKPSNTDQTPQRATPKDQTPQKQSSRKPSQQGPSQRPLDQPEMPQTLPQESPSRDSRDDESGGQSPGNPYASKEEDSGATKPAPRTPLRRRDRRSSSKSNPPVDDSKSLPPNPQADGDSNDPSPPSTEPLGRKPDRANPSETIPRDTEPRSIEPPATDPAIGEPRSGQPQSEQPGSMSPRVAPRGAENDTSSPRSSESPDRSATNPTPPIDLNALRPQLQELQKLVEQMESQRQNSASSEGQPYDADRFNQMPLRDPRTPNGAQDSLPGANRNEPERPSASRIPRDSSRSPNTQGDARNGGDNTNSASSMPEIPEFLKQELRKLKLLPDSGSGKGSPSSNSDVADNQSIDNQSSKAPSVKPDRKTPSDPSPRSSRPADSSSAEKRAAQKPAIDIEKELEQKGFARTLEKIFQRAKEESLKPKPPAEKTIADGGKSPDAAPGADRAADNSGQPSPELSQSMINVLDGLKDDLVEIARDAKFNDPPAKSDRFRQGRRESAGSESSTLNELRKKAADFLAGPNESPLNSPPAARSTGSGTTNAANALDAASQFDLMPLLILVTVLAAAAIGLYGARHLRMRSANALALQMAGPPIQPAEIQTRADVIRAFHDLALRSTRSVQTWWTHRAVQRVIATAAPEKQAAVETLANAYEEARYLPQEVELSSEQIQSARNALQQCRTGGKV